MHPSTKLCLQLFLSSASILALLPGSNAHPTSPSRPGTPSGLQERALPWQGVHIIPGNCPPQHLQALETAVLDASYLAGAGLNAAANFSSVPFSYFFPSDPEVATTVAEVYQRVIDAHHGRGTPIPLYCDDIFGGCANSNWFAYAINFEDKHIAPSIVMCSSGSELARNPQPCTADPGGYSLGALMLHELTHIPYILGGPAHDHTVSRDSGSHSARDTNFQMTRIGLNMTDDANAYSFLGSWAYDLGLGAEPWHQESSCLENFAKGQFDLMVGETGEVDPDDDDSGVETIQTQNCPAGVLFC